MQDLQMTQQEKNRSMGIPVISELCSNSLLRQLPGNGKGECWLRDMRKIPSAKAGSMVTRFQQHKELSGSFTCLRKLANYRWLLISSIKASDYCNSRKILILL
jgi:hypothetical protein